MKMKRILSGIIAALLLAALAAPALADAWTLYTSKDDVKVFARRDTDSRVLKKIKKKGTKVLLEEQKGNWFAILVEAEGGDGQTLGWIRGKDLMGSRKPKDDKKKKDNKKDKKKGSASSDDEMPAPVESLAEGRVVEPEVGEIDVNHLEDGMYPVAFDPGDVASLSSGVFMNAVQIYTEDWYDIVDISTLEVGDTIVVAGEPIEVKSIDRSDGVAINGGLDEGGITLGGVEDTNGLRVWDYDDLSSYTLRGTTTLVLDPSATYTDGSDPEAEPVTVGYDDIVAAINGAEMDSFTPYNTTVTIEGGKVVEINRIYVP